MGEQGQRRCALSISSPHGLSNPSSGCLAALLGCSLHGGNCSQEAEHTWSFLPVPLRQSLQRGDDIFIVGRIGAFRKSNPWCNQPGPRHPSPTSLQCSPGAAVLSLGHRPLGLAVPYSCPAPHHIAGSPVWAQSSPTPAGLP